MAGAFGATPPPQLLSATINTNGTSLTLVFSRRVRNLRDPDGGDINVDGYALSGGQALSTALSTDNGVSWNIGCAQVYQGAALTLDYIPGTTEDLSGIALAAFSGLPVTNHSTQPEP
ncbi:MAG TPA: hypothetical protein VFU47_01550 [Armatimonadota bacterium]|nr:hypothetical protein [Armatimonadota bacterium]